MRFFYFLIILKGLFYDTNSKVMVNDTLITMKVGNVVLLKADVSNTYIDGRNSSLVLITQHDDIVFLTPRTFEIEFENDAKSKLYRVTAKMMSLRAGKSAILIYDSTPRPKFIVEHSAVVSVQIYKYTIVEILSVVEGWMCYTLWSLSFYPQIVNNYMRRSVSGLSLDFVIFNLFGYVSENIFNLGTYFELPAKNQSSVQYPRSLNPVDIRDVLFSIHALVASIVMITQCLLYNKSNQNISIMTVLVLPIFLTITAVLLNLALSNIIRWMDVLYYFSLLQISFIVTKYLPQIYMIYKRKTTLGFSMLSALLDFMGGFFSTAYMLMDAYNYEDWALLSKDSIKFGVGVVSMAFNGIFFFQRYFLYRTDDDNARNAEGIEMSTFRARS